MATRKLTTSLLKRLIKEEKGKLPGKPKELDKCTKEVETVDAADLAQALSKKIDFMKALKIEEAALTKIINKMSELGLKEGNSVGKANELMKLSERITRVLHKREELTKQFNLIGKILKVGS